MNGPIIGITTNSLKISLNFSQTQKVVLVAHFYIDPIIKEGGIPILIPNTIPEGSISKLIDKLDGILLIGGQDVDSRSYGQKRKINYSKNVDSIGTPYERPIAFQPDFQRDQLEIALYKEAKKRCIPIFGICRGMQIINVAEGGSLIQEVDENSIVRHWIDEDGYIHHHTVDILEGSLMYEIFRENEYCTSSAHHQAIDQLGRNLIASGVAKDGIVEFIESANKDQFIIGIQGHPEKTMKNFDKYTNIFKKFISDCKFLKK